MFQINIPGTSSLNFITKMQAAIFQSRRAVGMLHCLTDGSVFSVGAGTFFPHSSTSCEVPLWWSFHLMFVLLYCN